jgi:hypothetical protein
MSIRNNKEIVIKKNYYFERFMDMDTTTKKSLNNEVKPLVTRYLAGIFMPNLA